MLKSRNVRSGTTALPIEFPDDESMRVSHEAIYQALYVQDAERCGKSSAHACGRALRVPAARSGGRGKGFISDEVKISQRPAEVADRAVPGHWEGDLIIGLNSSAMGTLVKRTTRFTLLLHLPRTSRTPDAASGCDSCSWSRNLACPAATAPRQELAVAVGTSAVSMPSNPASSRAVSRCSGPARPPTK